MEALKKSALLALAVIFAGFLLTSCGAGETKRGEIELTYFYDSPCASCDTEEKFRTLLNEAAEGLSQHRGYGLTAINTFQLGYDKKNSMAKERGIDNPGDYNTVLFIGDSVLLGDDEIKRSLRQFYWQEVGFGSSGEVIEYFYRDDCPDCRSISGEMDEYLNNSIKTVVRIDTGNQQTKAAFRSYIEKNGVDPSRYQIPYLVEDSEHYSGVEEIQEHIKGG